MSSRGAESSAAATETGARNNPQPFECNLEVLATRLVKDYNVPPLGWWEETQHRFNQLCAIICPQEGVLAATLEDTNQLSYVQSAWQTSLPVVRLLPTGTHLLRLTATNEPLECIAFGTMSEVRFEEVFWYS